MALAFLWSIKSKLADGVSQLTIFNASRQPICERLFFKNPQLKLNIVTKIGQDNYQARKPVTISLELPNVANMPQRANMSMSVLCLILCKVRIITISKTICI